MKSKIEEFFENLEKTNIELSDFVDIDKIEKNVDEIQMKLNTLNFIICSSQEELERRIKSLFKNDKNVFIILPYLIAISKNKIKELDEFWFRYKDKQTNIYEIVEDANKIIDFFNLTGLSKLIINGKIKNFVDYLVGVEVGLDSNARKNRFGLKNEKEIEKIIDSEFSKYPFIKIDKQLKISSFENNGSLKDKKFDFIIRNENNGKNVVIETSFYNAQGSKINETSRSFRKINEAIKNYSQTYSFVWIADGEGMNTIKNEIINNELSFDFLRSKNNFIDEIKKILEIKQD